MTEDLEELRDPYLFFKNCPRSYRGYPDSCMPSHCYGVSGLRLSPRVAPWSTKPQSMPRCAAPQWQLLRDGRSIHTPCRTLRRVGPPVFAAKRQYAKSATSDSESSPSIRTLNSAILIPGSVKDVVSLVQRHYSRAITNFTATGQSNKLHQSGST